MNMYNSQKCFKKFKVDKKLTSKGSKLMQANSKNICCNQKYIKFTMKAREINEMNAH